MRTEEVGARGGADGREDVKYGLWGGTFPGGWCSFKVAEGGNHIGYAAVGSLEEAQAGLAVFLREACDRPDRTYEVAPFDADREPASVDDVPTRAQADFLRDLLETGDFNSTVWGRRAWRATSGALFVRGWYMHDAITGRIRLTKAGRAALDRVGDKT